MSAQIGIGVPSGENPEAALDVRYDAGISPGILIPRVTVLPTDDIENEIYVPNGLMVLYCPDCTDTDDDGNINYEEGIFYLYTDHDGDGDLEWTTLAETSGITPPDTQAPSVPNNLIASDPTMTTINLSWVASSDNIGVSGYKIYFSDGTLAQSGISGTSTIITGLSLETSYTFYVTAYDAAGNESNAGTNGDTNWATEETTGGCVQTTFCEYDFDNNDFGCWNGDNGASISDNESYSGDYSVKLDGDDDENIWSGQYDFTGFAKVEVGFWALTEGFGSKDKYSLEIKIGNGNYEKLVDWRRDNGNWILRTFEIVDPSYLTENITIRIRNRANEDDEEVYIDDASIIGYCN
jgi:hypothetical protein